MVAEVLLVISTFPDAETAQRIAHDLVTAKLAACANITAPVESIYRWQGKIADEQEVVVLLKTRSARLETLQVAFAELHPYKVPELLALPVSVGNAKYLEWINGETTLDIHDARFSEGNLRLQYQQFPIAFRNIKIRPLP